MSVSTQGFNNTSANVDYPADSLNGTAWLDFYTPHPNPFKNIYIKITFIFFFSAVFTLCVIGNFLVIFVVLRHRKMRTTTNIFLSNLAAADLSVGIFCIIPTLLQYISPVWYLGKVMCKLLYFVQMMAYVASIMTLTFIALERYFAILHPLRCKTWKRLWRMRAAVVIIWLMSAATGFPQLIYRHTSSFGEETFCLVGQGFNRYAYVITNFILWYILPLLVIIFLYLRISIVLWNTSKLDRPSSNALRGWRREKRVKYSYKSSKYTTETTNGQACNSEVRISIEDELHERSNSTPGSSVDEGLKTILSEGHEINADESSINNPIRDKIEKTILLRDGSKKNPPVTLPAKRLLPLKDVVPPRKGSNAKPNHLSPIKPELSSALQELTSETTTASGITLSDSYTSVALIDRDGQSSAPENIVQEQGSQQYTGSMPRAFVSQTWTWSRSEVALRARRRVIRLLMAVALAFALCVLPYHIQMVINESSSGIELLTFFDILRNQLTSLLFYFNSALNPILYAFLSDNFRKSLRELLPCHKCHSAETSGTKLSAKPVEYRRNGNSSV